MTSTFFSLQIGVTALQAGQMGVETTGHNIANANTAGYARETVDLETANSLVTWTDHQNFLGQGVNARGQNRVVNEYLNQQYRENNATETYWSNKSNEVNTIAQIFNEPTGTTLRNNIDQFFSGWTAIAQNPQDDGARATVLEYANNLADAFHTTATTLSDNQTRYASQMIDTASQVNTLTKSISDLNGQIEHAQQSGAAPNDLLDQRDALLDKLSQYVPIDVKYTQPDPQNFPYLTNMTVTLKVKSGSPETLVQDSQTPFKFTVPTDVTDTANLTALQGQVSNVQSDSGSLGALNDMYQYIQTQITSLDNLATTIETDVNNTQEAGFAKDGTTTGAALDLFGGTSASTMNVLLTSGDKLAAAKTANSPTDGSNASDMVLHNNDIDAQYARIVNTLADDGQSANEQQTTFSALTTQVTTLRQSVSGVNINEEMTNMIQYQQAYGAASKFINTYSQMLDTLINEVK